MFGNWKNLAVLVVAISGWVGMEQSSTAQIFGQRRGFQIGGPNGVVIGGGRGVRIGGINGVQIGAGEGLRFGPPGIGVQYGGGQGIRYGTTNFGVQYGNGQIFRYGAPNAGVRLGGGTGFRMGTPNGGVQIGGGQGFQLGRLNSPIVPRAPIPAGSPFANSNTPIQAGPSMPNSVAPMPSNGVLSNQPQMIAPVPVDRSMKDANSPSIFPSPLDRSGNPTLKPNVPANQYLPSYRKSESFLQGTGPGQMVLSLPNNETSDLIISANGSQMTLSPGKPIRLSAKESWDIIVPGTSGEPQKYTLTKAGAYPLVRTESGWSFDGLEPAKVSKVGDDRVEKPNSNQSIEEQPAKRSDQKEQSDDNEKSVLKFKNKS